MGCIGMSVRVWKRVNSQRPERIWAFWRRIIWMSYPSKLRMMPAMTILNKCDNEFFFCFDQTYSVLYVLLFLLTRLSIFVSEVHIFLTFCSLSWNLFNIYSPAL